MGDIFGEAAKSPIYVAAFTRALTQLWAHGVRSTIGLYLEEKL